MMVYKEVSCAVCEKLIKIKMGSHAPNSPSNFIDSDEGVLMINYKKWFCNNCWKEIQDYYRKMSK